MNVGIRVCCYFIEGNCSVVTNSNIKPLDCHEFSTKHLLILISTVPRNTTTFATRWYVYCKGKLALFACNSQEMLLGSWKTKICINFKEMNQDITAFCRSSHWACPFPSPLLHRRHEANPLGPEQGHQPVGYDIDYSFSTIFCKKCSVISSEFMGPKLLCRSLYPKGEKGWPGQVS